MKDTERRAFSCAVYARRGGPGGEVLVIEHRRLQTWLPIGGELEAGETPLDAAAASCARRPGSSARFGPLVGASTACRPA